MFSSADRNENLKLELLAWESTNSSIYSVPVEGIRTRLGLSYRD